MVSYKLLNLSPGFTIKDFIKIDNIIIEFIANKLIELQADLSKYIKQIE
jgi:hypothetical protein